MPNPGVGPSILPVTRGPLVGTNTYHRYIVFQTQNFAFGHPITSDLRWHLGLDKVYYQMLAQNHSAIVISVDWDVFLRFDNVEDDLPYNSGTLSFPVTGGGASNYDVQSFPLGGLAFPGSCEYYVRLTLKQNPGMNKFMISLWACPELWYGFRTTKQAPFAPV